MKADKKRLENLIEELSMKDVNLQQRFQEVQQEEKHSIQQLEETSKTRPIWNSKRKYITYVANEMFFEQRERLWPWSKKYLNL